MERATNKKSVKESLKFAKQFTFNSIKNAKKIGKGILITDIYESDNTHKELSNAINNLIERKIISFDLE